MKNTAANPSLQQQARPKHNLLKKSHPSTITSLQLKEPEPNPFMFSGKATKIEDPYQPQDATVVTNSNEYLSALKTSDPLVHNIRCKKIPFANSFRTLRGN